MKISSKELSFCHKLKYSYPYILATQCRRSLIFQTFNSVKSKNLSLKYQRFIPTGCRDLEIRKFEVVAKTQFLYVTFLVQLYDLLSSSTVTYKKFNIIRLCN